VNVVRLEPDRFDWASGSGGAAEVRRICEAATSADGRSPLDEAALLELGHRGLATGIILAVTEGGSTSNEGRLDGYGYVRGLSGAGRPELDLVVDPESRGRGVGATLARAVLDLVDGIPLTAWSHGDHPAARALAERLGFAAVRELWLMRRPSSAPLPGAEPLGGVTIRPFRPGTEDEAQFLAVNAAAFATHPEQGALDHDGLVRRMREPWFDPAGFLLAVHESRVVAFHWTKEHPPSGDHPAYGEVYVIGVDPSAQAGGVGRALLAAGLGHLQDKGLAEVVLYVEADNGPATGLYEAFGFTHAARDTDVMYGPA
jgi:mycothiol synthase